MTIDVQTFISRGEDKKSVNMTEDLHISQDDFVSEKSVFVI